MSADNQPGAGSPEQKEWEGQRWEYLVLNTIGMGDSNPAASVVLDKEHPDQLSMHYSQKIKELQDSRQKKGLLGPFPGRATLVEVLNLLGKEGWELVSATPTFKMEGTGHPVLFLKRRTTVPF